jgi:hypothetical protein
LSIDERALRSNFGESGIEKSKADCTNFISISQTICFECWKNFQSSQELLPDEITSMKQISSNQGLNATIWTTHCSWGHYQNLLVVHVS